MTEQIKQKLNDSESYLQELSEVFCENTKKFSENTSVGHSILYGNDKFFRNEIDLGLERSVTNAIVSKFNEDCKVAGISKEEKQQIAAEIFYKACNNYDTYNFIVHIFMKQFKSYIDKALIDSIKNDAILYDDTRLINYFNITDNPNYAKEYIGKLMKEILLLQKRFKKNFIKKNGEINGNNINEFNLGISKFIDSNIFEKIKKDFPSFGKKRQDLINDMLYYACFEPKYKPLVYILVNGFGADISKRNRETSETPFDIAKKMCDSELLKFFITKSTRGYTHLLVDEISKTTIKFQQEFTERYGIESLTRDNKSFESGKNEAIFSAISKKIEEDLNLIRISPEEKKEIINDIFYVTCYDKETENLTDILPKIFEIDFSKKNKSTNMSPVDLSVNNYNKGQERMFARLIKCIEENTTIARPL